MHITLPRSIRNTSLVFILLSLCTLLFPNLSQADALLTVGKDTGFCVDTNGSKVFIKQCNNTSNTQKWRMTFSGEIRNGHYRNKCIEVPNSKFKKSKKVALSECHGKVNQVWRAVAGQLRIDKYCLDVPASQYKDNRQLIIYKCTFNPNQKFGTSIFEIPAIENQTIRTLKSTLCVDTDGYNVFMARCDSSRTSQNWGRTLSSKHSTGEIRNAAYPRKCLDIRASEFKNNTDVILFRCHGGKNQLWKIKDKVIRIKNKVRNYCLNVDGNDIRVGNKVTVRRCGINKKNQQFVTGPLLKTLTPQAAAEMGFPQFAACKEFAENDYCYLGMTLVAPLNQSTFRYGFRTGSWPSHPTTGYTLDFGEDYSLDRCSRGHDSHLWDIEGEPDCANDLGYIHCLNRIKPKTANESTSVLSAKIYFKTQTKDCTVTRPKDGSLPPNDKIDGTHDTNWFTYQAPRVDPE